MTAKLPFVVFIAIILLQAPAFAEREVEKIDAASHVVTGKVSKIFRNRGVENDEYLVQIRIATIEKGQGYRRGDLIYSYGFQRRKDAPKEAAASGHQGVPREGQMIQARIKRGKGMMEGLYPYWFEVLEEAPTKLEKNETQKDTHSPRLEGLKEALADLEKGALKHKGHPAEPYGPYRAQFIRLLKSECGVTWEFVTALESTSKLSTTDRDELRKKMRGYNDIMDAEIKYRFGKDIFAKLNKQAKGK